MDQKSVTDCNLRKVVLFLVTVLKVWQSEIPNNWSFLDLPYNEYILKLPIIGIYHWKYPTSNSTLMLGFQCMCTDGSKPKWWVPIIECQWVRNVKFDFDVSVRQCLLSTDTLKSNSTFGTFSDMCPQGQKMPGRFGVRICTSSKLAYKFKVA